MKWTNLLLIFFIAIVIARGKSKTLNPYYSKDGKVLPEITSKFIDRSSLISPSYSENRLQKNVIDLQGLFIPYNAAKHTLFKLYTRSHPTVGEDLKFDADFIKNSTSFDPSFATRVIIHGWNNNFTSQINLLITKAYLDRGNFNIIVIEWGKIAINPNYFEVKYRLKDVGAAIAKFIDFMVSNNFIDLSQLSIIGHSLGAHVAGFTGRNIKSGKVQTIIGLDPAGPMFSKNDKSSRLSDNDAVYVEIIHTNAGVLGFKEPIGHADFYPNGGVTQAGCVMDLIGACAHVRAYEYFAESLKEHNSFLALKCPSYLEAMNTDCKISKSKSLMGGEPPNRGLLGTYRLSTHSKASYGMD